MHRGDALERVSTVFRRVSTSVAWFRCSRDVIARPISIARRYLRPVVRERRKRETTREIGEEASRGRTIGDGEGREGRRWGKKGRMGVGSGRREGLKRARFTLQTTAELGKLRGAPDTTLPSENLANKRRKQERGESRRGWGACIKVSRYVNGFKTVEYISRIDDIRPPWARSFFFSLSSSFSTSAEEITPDVE